MIPVIVEPITDEETGKETVKVSFEEWRKTSMTMFHNWGRIRDFLMLTPEYSRKDVTMMKLIEQINATIVNGVLLTTVLYNDIIIDPKFDEFIEKVKVVAGENSMKILLENAEDVDSDALPPEADGKIICPGGKA